MHLPLLLTSLLGATALATDLRPCGFRIAPCPSGTTCEKTDPACTRGENCAGLCVPTKTESPTFTTITTTKPSIPRETYQSCGGMRIKPVDCAKGFICVDDPYVRGCGMACDRPGICVKPEFCGGFAGFACKDKNKICVDDPRDDCDPLNGGADCGGICI
ncbi:hypothetical protein B0T16DRAFT_226284 [Cercophora newfieldiana]|uniref:Uncharacterized protein n=1 Tax=Cercophora newfieldiana TaxID=92897 RepID=A0AA39XS94_9PEZI|nr:hypothetical protein B0T16DRAFT_226284 [Cercophora newfieldiana]